ncbi:MAG: cell division protein FtsL [Clostridiales Family XIII bacterium]|jgi:cell division protein FtsL|nr:cell division protein FtsL [Clostridiales Family XIII bacterium]
MIPATNATRARTRHDKRDAYYGVDLAPKQEREKRPAKPAPKANTYVRANLLVLLLLSGIIMVVFGIVPANYDASIQQHINQTIKDTAAINIEIENLEVQIKNASGISRIESRAIEELGMIYPLPEQFVFIVDGTVQVNDFAQYIKENAYELW